MKLIALLVAMILLSGCAWWREHQSHPKSPPPIETSAPKKSRRGITTRGQKWMLTSIDLELQREKRGERPSSGKSNWREYWEWRRSLWRKDPQAKEYDRYYARRRKELGLPR